MKLTLWSPLLLSSVVIPALTTIKKYLMIAGLLCLMPFSAMADEITVAAAANLQFTLEEIKAVFEEQTGDHIKVIIGSSGKLTTQIENGAPFDIFMSADVDYPQRLYNDGVTLQEPKIYAYGVLVLCTLNDVNLSQGVSGLSDSAVKNIAIASPQTAPYGRQAVNAMKYFHLYPSIESKLVYGENIAQVNQFVTTKAVDVGFTAKSVVLAENMKNQGRWVEVDPQSCQPIAQAAVILKSSHSHEPLAQKFFNFLFSPEVQDIFKKNGYRLPD